MAEPTYLRTHHKKRFAFKSLARAAAVARPLIRRDEWDDDVWPLQTFLSRAGYLRRYRVPGCLCPWTSAALRHFQKCYGLADTGEADAETLRLIERPRCGVPDIPPSSHASGPAPFVAVGCRYNQLDFTFAFFNSTPDLSAGRDHAIVREAFAVWQAVTPLRFVEVPPTDPHTFSVAFERLDHGDGSAFDDAGTIQGNTLAHAFFPPPCGGQFAGALHFDEFEGWADGPGGGGIRLLNVAIHEIGHLLGLSHSNNRQAIMFAFYDEAVDRLFPDDVAGIQSLYGRPNSGTPIRGQLTGDGDSQTHRIAIQSGPVRVALRGSTGQDFDLYVRAGVPPTRDTFDARGFTSSADEEVRLVVPSGGDLFVMIDSWRGNGPYELVVTPS